MARAPQPGTASPKVGLWILGAVVIGGLLLFGGDTDEVTSWDAETVEGMATADPPAASAKEEVAPPVPSGPVERSILRRASAHYRLATRDEGIGGAVVYSRNCYAGLKMGFSWRRLDACGAFDAAAGASGEELGVVGADWLEGETSAGRYLSAAVAAGMPAADADVRLAGLQSAVARAPDRLNVVAEPKETVESAEPTTKIDDNAVPDILEDPAAPVVEPPSANQVSSPPDNDEGAPLDVQ